MAVANFRYNHLAAPWDSPLSFGVQAFIEYNGVVLNDRYQSDVIRVTGITGLDGADVRDAREPIPSAHGEFIYDAFYGGRTLVLNGFIETGSLQVLKKLERNVKSAFAPLIESPLKFRWFDIEDNFEDSQSLFPYNPIASYATGNYSSFIGSLNNLEIKNNSLYWAFTNKNVYILRTAEQRTFCDAQQTLKCTVGSTTTASTIGFIQSVKDEKNHIRFLYNQNSGEPFIIIQVISEGEVYELEKVSLPAQIRPVVGQSFWIRGRKEGHWLTMEYWLELPQNNVIPTLSTTTFLTGKDSETFGDGVLAQVGLGGEQKDTLWAFNEFKVESIYPGDVIFNARVISKPDMKDEQTTLNKFKRAFQYTLRASDFRAFASAQSYKSLIPTEVSSPVLGRTYPRKYPLSYRKYTSSTIISQNNILSVNNRGTVFVEPIFYLKGPIKGIIMENLINGQKLVWTSIVEKGEILIFDCKNKTLVNNVGVNKAEFLEPTLQWMKLEPMWNDIYISGSGISEETELTAFWRHGFIG